jgi:hypothetical protein
MNHRIETAYFEPNPGDHVRIIIEFEGQWKPIFWIEVARDGSIYLAPRKKRIKSIRHGISKPINGSININYSDGEIIENKELYKGVKTSFHASGAINGIGNRKYRDSLRNLKEQQMLCFLLFQHPEKFDSIQQNQLKARDICLRFPVEEKNPIAAYIHISPEEKTQIVEFNDVLNQVNIILPYKGLENCNNIVVQINLISILNEGEWPPYTYEVYPTND